MEKVQPKISIVIPIYNAEKFIRQTLYSCTNQTFKDIEIICVNDCSKDNTAKILEEIANSDTRVHCVHHQINLGEGLARKSGIQAASGKYIMFLDADDSLMPNACKELYRAMETENVDMIQFGTSVNASDTVSKPELDGLYKILTPYPGKITAQNQAGLVPACFADHHFAFSIWNKIYRTSIVQHAVNYYNNERFDMAADLYLFFLIAFFSKTYASVNKEYYCYNFGVGITGGKAITDKVFTARARINKIVCNLSEFCKANDPLGYTDDSINDLKKVYASAIVYALVFQGEELDKAAAMETIFQYYDSADIISEFLTYYHNFEDSRKKELLDLWIDAPAFSSHKAEVKTIGTFYYRLMDGGVERVTSLLMDIWCRLGYQVVLFTDELPNQDDYKYPSSVTRVVVPKLRNFTVSGYRERVTYWQNMIRQYGVDTMVYHAWVSDEIAADILAIKSTHIPTIVHTHGLFAHGVNSQDVRYAYNSINISRLFKLVDAVITLNDTDYHWWSMMHHRVYRTNNPLTFNIDEIKPASLSNRPLLYLGRIHPDKRVEDCIKILKAVLDADCKAELHIVGGTDYQDYYDSLKKLAKELKVSDYVTFHGFQTDVSKFYQNASINLLTSVSEGFGMTLIEAMANGVPSVVYDLPNIDIVQKRKGIKVVPQGDVRGAAREIIALLSDDHALQAEGQAARQSVLEAYALSVPEFWKSVFTEVGSGETSELNAPDYAKIRNAVTIMVDNYLEGVEKRSCISSNTGGFQAGDIKMPLIEKWTDRFPDDVDPYDVTLFPGDRVLALCQRELIGIKYLVRFFFTWIKVKLFRKRKK